MREDHYDGEHSLYRLAAYVTFNAFKYNNFIKYLRYTTRKPVVLTGKPPKNCPTHLYLPEAFKELEYVLNHLSQLPVRPHHLFVDNGYGYLII